MTVVPCDAMCEVSDCSKPSELCGVSDKPGCAQLLIVLFHTMLSVYATAEEATCAGAKTP
jgi:hypothetical protein